MAKGNGTNNNKSTTSTKPRIRVKQKPTKPARHSVASVTNDTFDVDLITALVPDTLATDMDTITTDPLILADTACGYFDAAVILLDQLYNINHYSSDKQYILNKRLDALIDTAGDIAADLVYWADDKDKAL